MKVKVGLIFQNDYECEANIEQKNMSKRVKIIFLGDTAAGKSCIISSINGHPFSSKHEPTIGMDFSIKMHSTPINCYKLQLWDTAGQQKFRSVMPSYIRNSKVAILVYDVTNTKSFNNLDKWIELYQQNCLKDSMLILVGNKIDLYGTRKVKMEKVQQKIEKYNLKYQQVSAKSGQGIEQLLDEICQQLDKMNIELAMSSINPKSGAKLQIDQCPKRSCCGSLS